MTRHKQSGFTIIELLVATLVFSVTLIVLTFGLLQIGRIFYKGLSSTRSQEATRSVIDDVTQTLRFNGGSFASAISGGLKSYCIGTRRYTYDTSMKMNQGTPATRVLVVDDIGGGACTVPADYSDPAARRVQLVGEKMRIGEFTITEAGKFYTIKLQIGYGDDDLFEGVTLPADTTPDSPLKCKDSRDGGQYCSVSTLETAVQKRL